MKLAKSQQSWKCSKQQALFPGLCYNHVRVDKIWLDDFWDLMWYIFRIMKKCIYSNTKLAKIFTDLYCSRFKKARHHTQCILSWKFWQNSASSFLNSDVVHTYNYENLYISNGEKSVKLNFIKLSKRWAWCGI